MIIYNVTSNVEPASANEWITWLKEEHIPDMKATGCFYNVVICHLLETEEHDGVTYAVQYHARDLDNYKQYLADFSEGMRKKGTDKWNNKVVSFRSLLEVVH